MSNSIDWNAMAKPTMENMLKFEMEGLYDMLDTLYDTPFEESTTGDWGTLFVDDNSTPFMFESFLNFVDNMIGRKKFETSTNQFGYIEMFISGQIRNLNRVIDEIATRAVQN